MTALRRAMQRAFLTARGSRDYHGCADDAHARESPLHTTRKTMAALVRMSGTNMSVSNAPAMWLVPVKGLNFVLTDYHTRCSLKAVALKAEADSTSY